MEHSPSSEANSSTVGQESPGILCDQKIHSCFYTITLLIPILSHINPVYTPTHSLKIHFSIIHPSTPRSSKWAFKITQDNKIIVVATGSPSLNHTNLSINLLMMNDNN
jgi:hypothetical protein